MIENKEESKFFNNKVVKCMDMLLNENESCFIVEMLSNNMLVDVINKAFENIVNNNVFYLDRLNEECESVEEEKFRGNLLKLKNNLLGKVSIDDLLCNMAIKDDCLDDVILIIKCMTKKNEDEVYSIQFNTLIASILICNDEEIIIKILEIYKNLFNCNIIPKHIDFGFKKYYNNDGIKNNLDINIPIYDLVNYKSQKALKFYLENYFLIN